MAVATGAAERGRRPVPEGVGTRGGLDLAAALRRVRPALVELLLASSVINVLALATPLFMMTVYNKVIGQGALQTLDVLAVGMIGLVTFELLLRALRAHVASRLGARLEVAMGAELARIVLDLPLRQLEALAGRGIGERMRQLDQLRVVFARELPILVVDLVFVALFMAALMALAPQLGWLTLAAMPGFVLLSALGARGQAERARAAARSGAEKAACLNEALGQALSVKALALEGQVQRRFERRLVDAAKAGLAAGGRAGVVGSLAQALQHVTALAVVYVGARAIVAGDLTIGALVAATILSGRALAPMRQAVGTVQQLQQARAAWRDLEAIERAPPSIAVAAEVELEGRIRLDEVTFRYAPDRTPAVEGVTLEVGPGTMLALVGPPGSGKSTLVRLLLGLERPEHGRVLMDGHDVAHLPSAALRRQVGIVPQEVQLFAGTIAENIAAGAEDATFARLVAAAKFVGVHDTVQALPAGYDTELGDRGSGLSLGQRQLVAIARALVRNPRILVLDEATSSLDPATEAALLASLRRAARGRTMIVATHRRAVLDACDIAVMLERGRITRTGTPAEVLGLRPMQRPAE